MTYHPAGYKTSTERIEGIIQGRVMAKAVIPQEDGTNKIVAVFEESDHHYFFYLFTAPKGARRKAWKFTHQYYILYGRPIRPGVIGYYDLKSFVQEYMHTKKFHITLYCTKAELADKIERIIHPNIQPSIQFNQTFEYANGITSGRRDHKFYLARAYALGK